MRIIHRSIASAVAAALLLAGCGRDDKSLLSYVPADTPYAFANLEPIPADTLTAWTEQFGPFYAAYEEMLGTTLKQLEASPEGNERAARVAKALLAEMAGNLNLGGIQKIGIATDGHFALYGVGLVPVFRWELKDEAAFRALIGRVETRLGEKLPEAKLGDASYWRAGPAGETLAGIIAIVDGDLVLTLAPQNADDKLLRTLVGVDKPSDSLDADVIEDINDAGGFKPYGSGYIDTVLVAQRLIDGKTGVEKAFLDAFEVEDKPVDAVCREEFVSIARNFPRVTTGYTSFEKKHMEQRLLFEMKPEIAKDVAALAAPVPGLGAGSEGTVLDFGLSMDLSKLPAFVTKQAAAFKAKPYQCASLKDLNTSFAEMETQLANPMVMATAPVFSGFRAALTRFDRKDPTAMPDVAGKLVIASPNPQSLIALARTTVPAFASLQLKPGDEPVALPAELATPGVPPTYIAVTDKAIGVAVGETERATLKAFIAAPVGNPPPLLVANYSGTFMAQLMKLSPAPENADPELAAVQASMDKMADAYGQIFEHFGMTVAATERGIEMSQEVRLK